MTANLNVVHDTVQAPMSEEEIQKILMSEQAILGAVLNSVKHSKISLINDIFQQVKPSDFRLEENRVIFSVMEEIYSVRDMPDTTLVFQTLSEKGYSDKKYGEYVFRLAAQADTQVDENFSAHLKIVRNHGTLKELSSLGRQIEQLSKTGISANEVYQKSLDLLKSVPRNEENKTALVRESLSGFIDIIDERFNGKKESRWATQFEELDEAMHIEKGNVVIIAGRPSMGKTTIGLNFISNYVRRGIPSLVLSMEMSENEVIESLIGQMGSVNIGHIKRGTIEEHEWTGFNKAINTLSTSSLFINEQTRHTRTTLRNVIEQAVAEHGVEAVMIDYLQLIGYENQNANPVTEIGAISREVKLIAKELGIVIILLSQLNREVDKRPNKRPIMSDLKESSSIEQDADKILFVYRDELYNPDSEEAGTAEIIGAKNRGGQMFNVRMLTQLEFGRFKDFNMSNYSQQPY